MTPSVSNPNLEKLPLGVFGVVGSWLDELVESDWFLAVRAAAAEAHPPVKNFAIRASLLTRVVDDGRVEAFDGDVEGPDDSHVAQPDVVAGLGFGALGDPFGGGMEEFEQLGGTPVAQVAVLGQKGSHAFHAQAPGRSGGRVPPEEGQGDLAGGVGEEDLDSGPEGVPAGLELVVGDEVVAGSHHSPKCPALVTEGGKKGQLVGAQAKVLGNNLGVGGYVLGPGEDRRFPSRLDGVGRHRHPADRAYRAEVIDQHG